MAINSMQNNLMNNNYLMLKFQYKLSIYTPLYENTILVNVSHDINLDDALSSELQKNNTKIYKASTCIARVRKLARK